MQDNLKCLKCRWLCFSLTGYSDWTVTGEWINCPSGRFKKLDKYEDEKNEGLLALAAKDCPYYEQGEPAEEHSIDEPSGVVDERNEEFIAKHKPRPRAGQGGKMNTHISYKTAKRLKEFLGERVPEPMDKEYWAKFLKTYILVREGDERNPPEAPAYQLHDLLSKPFCEAMAKTECMTLFADGSCPWSWGSYYDRLSMENKDGGLPAVEKALIEMMEGK